VVALFSFTGEQMSLAIKVKEGQRFRELKVIRFYCSYKNAPSSSLRYYWFECSCGELCLFPITQVRNGGITSCGCKRKERAVKGLQAAYKRRMELGLIKKAPGLEIPSRT
jgi:hypothetical protein